MKKIKKWLRDWLLGDTNSVSYDKECAAVRSGPDIPGESKLRFTVTPALGGIVVSVTKYQPRTNDEYYAVHVIHDDDDIASNIGHIVSVELMKQ